MTAISLIELEAKLDENVSRYFSSDISPCSISEIAVTDWADIFRQDWADIFRQDFWLSHTPQGRYFFRQKIVDRFLVLVHT